MKNFKSLAILCAILAFSATACKTKAQREVENEKKKAEASAAASKEAEEEKKKEQAAEDNKRIGVAQAAYNSTLNFFNGVAGTYTGNFATTQTLTSNLTIKLTPVIPADVRKGGDRAAEIQAQIDGMGFDFEITEKVDKQVVVSCRKGVIKTDLKKGQIKISCIVGNVDRDYSITLDHVKDGEINESVVRSESVADSLLKQRLSRVEIVNVEISATEGRKFNTALDRTETSENK